MILILKNGHHEDIWKRGFVLLENPLPLTVSVLWLGGSAVRHGGGAHSKVESRPLIT